MQKLKHKKPIPEIHWDRLTVGDVKKLTSKRPGQLTVNELLEILNRLVDVPDGVENLPVEVLTDMMQELGQRRRIFGKKKRR